MRSGALSYSVGFALGLGALASVAPPTPARVPERVSVSRAGGQANGPSYGCVSISADGMFVAFGAAASNLVVGTHTPYGVFVRDRQTGTTIRAGVSSSGPGGTD